MDLGGIFFLCLLAMAFILPLASIIWLIVSFVRYKKVEKEEILKYEVRKTQWRCALWVFLGLFWCIGLVCLIAIIDWID